VIRLFNLYIPTRSLLLLLGEVAAVCMCFSLAILVMFRGQSSAVLVNQYSSWRIVVLAGLALLCSHLTEAYDARRSARMQEIYAKLLMLVGLLSLLLGVMVYLIPNLSVGRKSLVVGVCFLPVGYMLWWWVYQRVVSHPALRERVYLIGDGERARRIAEAIRTRRELGMDIVGWAGTTLSKRLAGQSLKAIVKDLETNRSIDRVIIALNDRRSVMPVEELLELRLHGIRIEDGTSLIEQISGQIEVEELRPSWMIFGDGFRFDSRARFFRRIVSVLLALTLSLLTLPLVPFIALFIWLGSKGPVLYKQRRTGLRGQTFMCLKFRTMRQDAEAHSGPMWAKDDDPRITKFGKFLRRSRLDEIPQLWNVIKGDMAFVGPRPERPEFVEKLNQEIPYYNVRHVARPGMTGWAQINYGYGSSVEEAKEKLRYDLYYIRNTSVLLDLIIVFRTFRAVIIGRGVR
jgi:sugar transferase (PEP-CTERM system associated)